uniref:Hypothetical chloroplast RF19 n=1 Tax=Canna indica TaxID=4628 RepID=U6A2T9_9LILI|nr:hypothetical chloroplast RF19 [Canna indica]YP_010968833.1 hypothetical chloroplast RF19 [Canna x generalis]AHA12813.1 hypothetical chloroplast RF19 [Canna indica]QJR53290.1 hypothetical chloroplast RF19 [Canna indica]UGY85618.1 hypothetical chloroplast RF19 [Canna indica]WNO19201.1 hypothetical chloroplast RF19 [Canna indica]WNO19285.1 hypothetical chloroplast RF19 [Canna indica]
MILKSFLLSNILSLCMKIINSVVLVGLYYGFLTTFSIGPSYLFLLRARVMEEGTEKEVSATTGFITGQLMMFISIYYAPLHLALGRPHTITVLVLPYLLFHFFWNNHKNFFDYGSTTRNSMRNLSIQCVFLNNLIFQLFNHFILPSSTLARLVNIYMFRCNNKMLFVTSSFIGWLIGHIFFMKWVGLVLVWIRQNHSIRSKSNRYLVSELRNSMARIFSILLFITCVYYLGRMPSPIVTKKLKETSETEERGESEEESDVETTSFRKETKQEQEGSTEEDPSLYSEEKEDPDKIDETEEIRVNGKEKTKHEFHFHFKNTCYKDSPVYEDSYLDTYQDNCELGRLQKNEKTFFRFEKEKQPVEPEPLVTFLFDYKRWNRPLRYIKNNRFENSVRNEMSQYFFYTCSSDGKEIISFTYPPSLSTFSEMIEQKISLYTTEKFSHEDLYNYWVSTNEQKKYNLSNELISRIKTLEKEKIFLTLDILEKRTRLCNDENEQEYLPKAYDPFLNGPYRGTIKKLYSHTIMNGLITSTENSKEIVWINKIHGLFSISNNSSEFEHEKNLLDEKSSLNYIVNSLTSINELSFESIPSFHLKMEEEKKMNSESKAKSLKLVFDIITTDANDQTRTKEESIGEESIGEESIEEEIIKKVPRWSYKLINELEAQEQERDEETEEQAKEDPEIRSRKAKQVVIYTDKKKNTDTNIWNSNTNIRNTNTNIDDNIDEEEEVTLIRYSQQPDFRRAIIKGSMRAQRRKTIIWELFQANPRSPLFLDREDKLLFFSFFDIYLYQMINLNFRNSVGRKPELQISNFEEEESKTRDKKNKEKEEENERIIISETWDSFIFAQAIRGLMLVTQSFLRKYIVLLSLIIAKNIGRMLLFQLPEWYEDLKEWNREMHVKCTYNGVQLSETEFPKDWLTDGIQIKILYPFRLKPWRRSKIQSDHKDLMKKKGKKENFCFLTIWGMETELPFGSPRKKPSFFEPIYKELEKKIRKVKNIFFLALKVAKEKKKEKKENNKIIPESTIRIQSMNWTNHLLIENQMKDLADKTITIRNQIEGITKDKKKIVPSYDDKRSELRKHTWQILKRKSTRLIRKSHYFMKSFIEKIYMDILLCMVTVSKVNARLSTKKIFNESIYNDERNQEGIDEIDQNTMNFISTIKNSFSNPNISNNSNTYYDYDLSSLSQAYVFYKLSQTQLLNDDHLRSVLQYCGTCPFIKDKIKYFFMTRGIFDAKSRHKKIKKSGMNEWKNWLKSHYPYNLSQNNWSRLVPKKWRNSIHERCTIQNKESMKLYSYKKEKLKKHYQYDLLSHEYINYGDSKDSYIYGPKLQLNRNIAIDDYIDDYLEKLFFDTHQILDRKYFDCRILHFSLRNNINIEDWTNIHIGTKIDKNTKTKKKFLNINKLKKKKKYLFFLTIHQKIIPSNQKKNTHFFDWMGMNRDSCTISNLEPWFFPEFVLPFDTYKIKPWIIPIKLLLSNICYNESYNENEKNISENKNIKDSIKIKMELKNSNQEKKKKEGQSNLVSNLQKQKKDLEENYAKSDIKKSQKKKESKKKKESELDLFLKKYFLFQLRWNESLNQKIINNIKVYCLLLRLINPRKIILSSIQRKEMYLDVMMSQKNLTLTKLLKNGILIIEPIRLSLRRDGKFIIYQTIGISLVDKNKHQINRKYIKKRYVNKKNFNKSTGRHDNMFVNRDQDHYNFLVPENILSPRRRRELRILICFNSQNWDVVNKNSVFCNENNIRNSAQFMNKDKGLNTDTNKLIKCKFFLWPNYRLEDLACMNRYWFDTNNGSRFSMSRIHIYPQFIII